MNGSQQTLGVNEKINSNLFTTPQGQQQDTRYLCDTYKYMLKLTSLRGDIADIVVASKHTEVKTTVLALKNQVEKLGSHNI